MRAVYKSTDSAYLFVTFPEQAQGGAKARQRRAHAFTAGLVVRVGFAALSPPYIIVSGLC
jgi:hypothetical protein